MSEQQAAYTMADDDAARIARMRASQVGVVQPDETILFLLPRLDALRAERDEFRRLAHHAQDLLATSSEMVRQLTAELVEALASACEAVEWLLEEDWPMSVDPGPDPGIRAGLSHWQALLAGRAADGEDA